MKGVVYHMFINWKHIELERKTNFEGRYDDLKSLGCGTMFWDLWISVKDMTEMFHVSKQTVLNWMRNEGLKHNLRGQTQLGRAVLLWDDVEDFIETKHPEQLWRLDRIAERIGRKYPLKDEEL